MIPVSSIPHLCRNLGLSLIFQHRLSTEVQVSRSQLLVRGFVCVLMTSRLVGPKPKWVSLWPQHSVSGETCLTPTFPVSLTLAQLILLLFHLLFFPMALLTWDHPPQVLT